MTEELEHEDSLNLDENQDSNLETDSSEELKKAQDYAKNQKIRAERAEKELKELKAKAEAPKEEKETPKNTDIGLSPKDYLALTEHRVSSDDFDEVVRLAKLLDKPIAETLKDGVVKMVLKQRAEERATAAASNTATTKRSAKVSDDQVLEKLEKGELDSDEDFEKAAKARIAKLKSQSN